ncbi:MAG: hypothetical protein D6677_02725 [Calditrichaeota bacterium]|nr:MAG: hypothetical protein D6677_02725 [Calditrichota bacterium]
MRLLLVVIFMTGFLSAQNRDFDEKNFFENLRASYYTLQQAPIHNYVVLVQNDALQHIAGQYWQNPEIFPMQLIWVKPQSMFLSQQGVPALPDSIQSIYNETVNGLKQQIQGLLVDMNRFYTVGIFNDIPNDYKLEHQAPYVRISFKRTVGGDNTENEYIFGENGLCLKTISRAPDQKRTIITLPRFRITKTQWLCTGWEVQMWQGDSVQTGYNITLEYSQYKEVWVPYTVEINVQQARSPRQIFADRIYFRNYIFDKSLQVINR